MPIHIISVSLSELSDHVILDGLASHQVKIYGVAHPAMLAEQEQKLALYTQLLGKYLPIFSFRIQLPDE